MKIWTTTNRISNFVDDKDFVHVILPFYYVSKCLGLAVYTVTQPEKLVAKYRTKTLNVVAVVLHVTIKSVLVYVTLKTGQFFSSSGIEIADVGIQIIQMCANICIIFIVFYLTATHGAIGRLIKEMSSVGKLVSNVCTQ